MSVSWSTVRRLFTGIDIAAMRHLGHPLDDYDYVARNANVLYARLADGSMPPPPFGPWQAAQLAVFKGWIDAGLPYELPVSETVSDFVGLSEVLTGFDHLHRDLYAHAI